MDAKRLCSMNGWGRSRFLVALPALIWVLIQSPLAARAEVRESIKRALPATVCVEWHGAAARASMTNPAASMMPAMSGKPGTDPNARMSARSMSGTTLGMTPDQVGMASGTIVSADGLIVTMLSASESGKYSVKLSDGRTLSARLLVDDRRTGLQLLKVDASELPYLVPASEPAQIGEEVTWTYCQGLKDRGAGRGIIATTGRDVSSMGSNLLQIDSAPPVGSAGAPLVDGEGRLLGIIAFRRESQRIGFAVPVTAVKNVLEARRGDEPVVVQKGMLGIAMTRAGAEGAAVVARPTTDSPAAAAGIHDGDVVVAIDGVKIETPEDIVRLVSAHAAGQSVKVTIRREGKEQDFHVPLVAPAPVSTATSPVAAPLAPVAPGATGSAAYPPPAPTSPPVRAIKPPGLTAVRPDSIYVVDADGKLHAIPIDPSDKLYENLRQAYGSLATTRPDAAAAVPSIQIQRSDMEKKLEEIGRDVLTLRQQMEKLTEEIQRLHKQLSNTGTKP